MIEMLTTQHALDSHRRKLGRDLGFELTEDQQVLWLLKQVGFDANRDIDNLPLEAITECEQFMARCEKINAIKLIRSVTGFGLKDAKDLVERRWQHLYDTGARR